ncbi:MAG TPA: GNAT family N-acetyltransferase [Acidimicrobiales bacterium]
MVHVIRAALMGDGGPVGEAHAEAWRVGYAELFPPEVLAAAVDLRRRMWNGLIGDPHLEGTVLVSEQEGQVVGFIHFGPAATNGQVGEVYGFYVHPSFWGGGSAQALMDEAVGSMSRSFPSAILWTHIGAARARRFYAKSSWSETGNQRQETLWDGLVFPAVEYERTLAPDEIAPRLPSMPPEDLG